MACQNVEIGKQALLNNLSIAQVKIENLEEIEFTKVNPKNIKEEEFSDEGYNMKIEHLEEIEFINVNPKNNEEEFSDKDYNIGGTETTNNVSERKPTFCRICNFEEITAPVDDKITENIKLCCDNCYKNNFIKYNIVWQENIYNFCKNCNHCTDSFKNGCYITNHNCRSILWCKKCSAIFDEQRDFELHYKICKKKSQCYVCDVCCKSYRLLSQLKQHKIMHSNKNPYTCINCSKPFVNLNDLKNHLQTYLNQKPYSAEDNISFNSLIDPKLNLKFKSAEKLYTCQECSKSFARLSYLKSHLLVHSSEKSYICQECSKSFARLSYLKAHLLVHSVEKPHACSVCSKSFSRLNLLKSHLLFHSGDKPYSCIHCSKSFTRSYRLKNHLLIHSGEKPYTCQECSKSFTRLSQLKSHLLVHSGVKALPLSKMFKIVRSFKLT